MNYNCQLDDRSILREKKWYASLKTASVLLGI